LLTDADEVAANGEDASPLIAAAKSDPSCSSCIRRALGVLAVKNATQLALIAAVAPAPLVGSAAADGELDGVEPEVDGGGEVLWVAGELELLQAVSARPRTTGSTATIKRGLGD
jgi:hypothetical protein